MTDSIQHEYVARRTRFHDEAARWSRLDSRLALVRGVTFLAGALLAAVWLAGGMSSPIWLLLPALAFVSAVLFHDRVLRKKRHADRGVALYDRGLERLAGRWASSRATGERYRDATHPYADDLDLFGAGSVFQLLWGGVTRLGEDRLAAWLLEPADRATILARQSAIDELRRRHDLREAVGMLDDAGQDGNQNLLRAWAGVPPRPIAPAVRATAVGLSLVFWVGLLLWFLGSAPISLPVGTYAACLILTFLMRQRVAEAVGRLERAEAGLTALVDVLQLAERESFSCPLLQNITARLATGDVRCSRRIAELHQLSHRFEAALYNQFFAPIALTFGLPIHLAHAAEMWRQRFGSAVPAWLDAAGEFEALLALSGYAVEHPGDPWPEIAESGPVFSARQLGHPLIADNACVRNDVAVGNPVRLLVVSGSNMAGKSTLMRSVGVNAVLALAGAPVRATSLTVSCLQVGTAIRVTDSLQTGKSLFFAAIERLKGITSLAEGRRPLLFLLDELLAGTNSHDRQIGADAVLRWLVSHGAIGIVTTHDLALTEIADALAPDAVNMHFRDVLVGDTMRFDYTLRPGVVDRGNALALMRLVGLMPNGSPTEVIRGADQGGPRVQAPASPNSITATEL